MENLIVEINWCDKNFECGLGHPEIGVIAVTDKSLDGVKKAFMEALDFHIEGMRADGDIIPEWLDSGNYEISYSLSVAAILRNAEQFTTMAAISRASGINQKLLSNYANAVKYPRKEQRLKIITGLHRIGKEFLSVC
ncbi:MAG: CopG family transcriptional regulator [Muribaculaceae bacterium]